MPRPVKSHIFRGRRYRIKHVPPSKIKDEYGWCDGPERKCKTIAIDNSLEELQQLDTYIHEAFHASNWDIDEAAVEQTATDIAKFLWRLGYRKVDNA